MIFSTVSASDLTAPDIRREAILNRADVRGALAEYAASQSALQLEIAKQYADLGWTVIATVRDPKTATELQAFAASHKNGHAISTIIAAA